jgi:hypothetical protein
LFVAAVVAAVHAQPHVAEGECGATACLDYTHRYQLIEAASAAAAALVTVLTWPRLVRRHRNQWRVVSHE